MGRLCLKNNIEKNSGSIIIPAKKYNKKCKKIKKNEIKFAGSIIGPAMAGPTGPFATALLQATVLIYDTTNSISSQIAEE